MFNDFFFIKGLTDLQLQLVGAAAILHIIFPYIVTTDIW